MKIRLKVDSIILHVFDQDLNLISLNKRLLFICTILYKIFLFYLKKQHALRQRRSIFSC